MISQIFPFLMSCRGNFHHSMLLYSISVHHYLGKHRVFHDHTISGLFFLHTYIRLFVLYFLSQKEQKSKYLMETFLSSWEIWSENAGRVLSQNDWVCIFCYRFIFIRTMFFFQKLTKDEMNNKTTWAPFLYNPV